MIYVFACRILFGESKKVRSFLRARYVVSRFAAAYLSAWLSLQLLNGSRVHKAQSCSSDDCEDHAIDRVPQHTLEVNNSGIGETADCCQTGPVKAGKTIDITILVVARAIDTLVSNIWRHWSLTSKISSSNQSVYLAPIRHADSLVFAVSSGMIMWAWVYLPVRLPRAYNKWIGEAAEVDPRLIGLLREARAGKFVYGQDTGFAPIVQGMCKEYGWPLAWGDPQKTIPIPCEIVHMGTGPSCHWHAAVRFVRAFKFALATYIPLQLLVKARNPSVKAFRRACEEAVRSSAFLGAFVGLFYYGVCLARTCLGPMLFDQKTITPMMWDSGLCVKAGCALCGWSILIEAETRRPELSMFVAPRALATLLPRQYDAKVGLVLDAWSDSR